MKISAVIPIYNSEKYIIETLESVINQSYPVDEVVIIDDCSSDLSYELVEEYMNVHPQVRLIRLPYNQGVSTARNTGMWETKNEWILLVDADDILERTLVEKQLERLKRELADDVNNISFIHPAYVQIDGNSQIIPKSEMRGVSLSHQDFFGTLLVRNFIITPTGMLVNKQIAREIEGFRTDLKVCEDVDFSMRMGRKGKVHYIDEVLVKYRRHLNNVTDNVSKTLNAAKVILDQYSMHEIEEAILGRSYSAAQNKQDLVKVLFQMDRYEQGYRELQTIVKDENPQVTLFLKSLYAIQMDQTDLAFSILQELVSMDVNHLAAINNLAILQAKTGQTNDARGLFEQCLKKSSAYLDAAHNLKVLNGEVVGAEFKYTLRDLRPNLLRYTSL